MGTPNTNPNNNNQIDLANQEDFLMLKDMKVLLHKELLTNQALYNAELSSTSITVMHSSMAILIADIHHFMSKRKPAADVGPSKGLKKSRAIVLPMVAHLIDAPSAIVIRTDIPLVAISSVAGEMMAHDVLALQRGFRSCTNIHQGWYDKVKAAIAEKNATLERLQAMVDREREAKEQEEKLVEEESEDELDEADDAPIEEALIDEIPTEVVPIVMDPTPAIEVVLTEEAPTVAEPTPSAEELVSTKAIINIVVVEETDH
ncbi:hypothetical protein COCNU_scaffold001971G000010 [Cocos nucifera]|nr:hypothetical protein [Cocos nucifera]